MLELLATENRALLQDMIAWPLCLAALIWGGGPERAVAVVWIICLELLAGGYFWSTAQDYRYADIDVVVASIDILAGFAWIAIALYANRNYPLFIAAMQLMSMTAHLARGLAEAVSPVAYAFMVVAPGWIQLLLLATGLARHVVRKRTYGRYRDWRYSRLTARFGGQDSGRLNDQGDQGAATRRFAYGGASKWRDELK